jgi:hypothetical protein
VKKHGWLKLKKTGEKTAQSWQKQDKNHAIRNTASPNPQ